MRLAVISSSVGKALGVCPLARSVELDARATRCSSNHRSASSLPTSRACCTLRPRARPGQLVVACSAKSDSEIATVTPAATVVEQESSDMVEKAAQGNWPTIPTAVQVAGDFILGEDVKYRKLTDESEAAGGRIETTEVYTGPNGEALIRTDQPPTTYSCTIQNPETGEEITVSAQNDRYMLFEAEQQGYELPFACRMGCCTQCAVKVKSGTVLQPEALGVSKGLREQGYALMCVAFAQSDLVRWDPFFWPPDALRCVWG
mmetsp:Transcript_4646/g.16647  ORF Transcript_4646/g.16647 Transcript_4646/m.16647 type:complete len:260 (+) Transcript_4646:75-854(+)